MTQEHEQDNPLKQENENIEIKPPEAEYLALAEANQVRTVELPKEGDKPKTLTESMDDATDMTDMQFAASHLFPKDIQINDIMIGRVAPEAFLSLLQMLVTDEVMTANPSKPINVNHLIAKNYTRITIGLEGRGRIDYAELVGAARETKKEDNLIKGL